MANVVLMPQIGLAEESAVLTAWYVKAGDAVAPGDKLFSVETGKASFDVEAERSGTVLALMAGEGDEVPIKAPVCALGEAGERFEAPVMAAVASAPGIAAVPGASGTGAGRSAAFAAPGSLIPSPGHAGVSPRARRLAEKLEIEAAAAAPTGAEGRVIERDILALVNAPIQTADGSLAGGDTLAAGASPQAAAVAAKSAFGASPAAGGYEDKPLSNMRKTIARNMMGSLQNSAQLTHTASFDASNILECRKLFKNDAAMRDISLTDMILYAVSRTLPAFPALNAWLEGDTIRLFHEINLACAVDTERGLMAPVIVGASKKTLPEISQALKTLAEECRSGSIAPDLLSGGSFTVSNLGQFGIESFTPILNPPQTGILGVNTITTRIREEDGVIKTYPCLSLSLTYDHRALDGAPASKFLQALCGNLERFIRLLAE